MKTKEAIKILQAYRDKRLGAASRDDRDAPDDIAEALDTVLTLLKI